MNLSKKLLNIFEDLVDESLSYKLVRVASKELADKTPRPSLSDENTYVGILVNDGELYIFTDEDVMRYTKEEAKDYVILKSKPLSF